MTIPSRPPSWDEITQFLQIDGWTKDENTKHAFWSKTLPSGERLETHTSFAGNKTMSPGRFSAILRTQLRVTKADFWQALQTGEAVERPSEPPEPVVAHELWVVDGLKHQLGMSDDEIAKLSPEEAQAKLLDHWSSPGG